MYIMEYYLTYEQSPDSKIIAKIKDTNKYVYLAKRNDENVKNKEFNDESYKKMEKKMIEMKIKPRERIIYFKELINLIENKAEIKDIETDDERLLNLYKYYCGINDCDHLHLDVGTFEIMPNTDPNKITRIYIAGMSESGKSYVAKMICDNYHDLFPKRKIHLVSELKKDETLDECKAKLNRVNPETFIDDPPTIEEFAGKGKNKGSMFIFDDYDNYTGKTEKALDTFLNQVCQRGRHENMSLIMSSHHLNNYKKTTVKLAETVQYVVFPKNTSTSKLEYFLTTYGDLEKNQVQIIKKLNTRWAMVNRTYPKYVISEHDIILLKDA
jgi:hypothetical protein